MPEPIDPALIPAHVLDAAHDAWTNAPVIGDSQRFRHALAAALDAQAIVPGVNHPVSAAAFRFEASVYVAIEAGVPRARIARITAEALDAPMEPGDV